MPKKQNAGGIGWPFKQNVKNERKIEDHHQDLLNTDPDFNESLRTPDYYRERFNTYLLQNIFRKLLLPNESNYEYIKYLNDSKDFFMSDNGKEFYFYINNLQKELEKDQNGNLEEVKSPPPINQTNGITWEESRNGGKKKRAPKAKKEPKPKSR